MNFGASWGISDSKFVWINNSFQDISNLEIRKEPKSVYLNYALVKDSGSVVVDKINCALTVSSTWDIVAFGDAGNIYIKSSGWSWQKVYTHASGYAILGCIEYNQYVYRATLDKLHRTDLTSIATAISSGTLTPTDLDWKTLNGITYSNGLRSSYVTDASTTQKVGMKIYAKKNYTLTDVWVSDWTNAATKGYLYKYYEPAAIAGNSLRLYTSADLDPTTWSATWTERRPSGDVDMDRRAVAVSRDWLKMVAWAYWGLLYTSADWGVNRTERYVPQDSYVTNNFAWWSTSSATYSGWLYFETKRNCKLTKVTKSSSSNATRCRLFSISYSLLATGSVSGNDATFDYSLTTWTQYIVERDNSWSTYTCITNWLWPIENIDILSKWYSTDWSTSAWDRCHNILNMTTTSEWGTWYTHLWNNAAMSDDGTKIIVSTNSSTNFDWRIYISTNSWTTFTEAQPAGDNNFIWAFTTLSWDGSTYFVWYGTSVGTGRLYSSTNGTDWTERQPINTSAYNRNCWWINYDGTVAMAWIYANTTADDVYLTSDTFGSWTKTIDSSSARRNVLWWNYDGSILVAAWVSWAWDIRLSTNWWTSWSDVGNWGKTSIYVNWISNIITYSTWTRLYQSIDQLNTSTELQPVGDLDKVWRNIKISSGIELLETVNVTANVATFNTALTAWSYYYILFDKEWSTRDPSYKTTDLPVTKTDINYVAWVTPILTTTTGYVITSIGTAQVQDVAHPMITSNWTLYIGDGQYVATIDPVWAYVWDTLTLAEMDKIHDITYNNAYVRIYCINGTNNDVWIAYFWDWVQEAPDQRQELPGKFRNVAMKDNIDYAIMGTAEPILYYYPYQRQVLKRIENLSSGIKSMCLYKNYLLFGCKGWVYSWGNFNKDYPEALNLERKTSNANDTDDIGCIWNSNGELYVSWKNDTTYGVDKLSTTTYNTTWYLTTKVYYGNQMWKRKDTAEIYIAHKPLTTGESIQIYTRENLSGSYTLKYTIDTTNGTWAHNSFLLQEERNELETKVVLNWPGTSTPEVYELILRHNEEDHG